MNQRPIVAAGLVVILTCAALALGCQAAGSATGGSPPSQGMLDPENENEARLNRLQPPDRVMDAVGVAPGQVVAEIGAGRGRYTVQLIARVGADGRVYAEDIDADALKHLRARCDRWNIRNVETVLGEVNDPRLPPNSLDLIFIISSFHHFDDPVTLMGNARQALKRTGRLAIVEWAPRPGRSEYLTPEQMAATMKRAGFTLTRTETFLLANGLYIYIFDQSAKPSSELR
ncbi:MAG TPA: class I SAM-dependent methyltransferase [Acidobacteriota bacterium]|nr:class I SAM-dependent methyltransferase [Acidobacteriota bacterium]HQM64686.1 class I SAM-dependent methyltransferase [Acidobacteriota bacterium]